MSDSHEPTSDKLYLMIALSLGVLTVVSYLADMVGLPKSVLVMIVLAVAVVKASLVATYFMHLKIDWSKVRVMLIPAAMLSAVLLIALLPDITLALRDKVGLAPVLVPAVHAAPASHAP